MVLFTLSDSVVVERARNRLLLIEAEEADNEIVERATAAVTEFIPSIAILFVITSLFYIVIFFAADIISAPSKSR